MANKWFIVAIVFFVILMGAAFYFHFWGQTAEQTEFAGGVAPQAEISRGSTPMEIAKQRSLERSAIRGDQRSYSFTDATQWSSIFTYLKYLFLFVIFALVILYFCGYKKIPNYILSKIPRKLRVVFIVLLVIITLMVLGSVSGIFSSVSKGVSFITGNQSGNEVSSGNNQNIENKRDKHSEKVVASHNSLQQQVLSSKVVGKDNAKQEKLIVSTLENKSKKFIDKNIKSRSAPAAVMGNKEVISKQDPINNVGYVNDAQRYTSQTIASGMVRIPLVGLHSVSSIGRVANLIEETIRSNISGKVVKILVEEGRYVKKGEPVFILDASGYEKSLDNAQSELQKAKVKYTQLMKQYSATNSDEIWKMQNKMKELQAMIVANKAYIRESTIVAHADGMITSINIDKGMFVQPGKPIIVVSNPSNLQVTYMLPAEYYKKIKQNSIAYLTFKKGAPYGYVSFVNYIASDIDIKTNMFIVRAVIRNNSELLKHGQAVYIMQTLQDQ